MSKELSSAAIFFTLFLTGVPITGAVPASRAPGVPLPDIETCDAPVQRFRGGPGRQPGATVVVVQMRQTIRNAEGEFVPASSLATKARVKGDEIVVRVQVWNRSVYDVGNVVLNHRFKPAPGSSYAEGIASVIGAVFSDQDNTFVIPRIEAGEEAVFTFKILLPARPMAGSDGHGKPAAGVSQAKMMLEDFTLLDSSRRYPLPTSLTAPGRSRMNVERVGLGAVEVSCFEGTAAEVEAAEPEHPRPLAVRYAPEREVPATAGTVAMPEIVMPQTGVEISRMFLIALQALLGAVIGAGLFGAGLWVVARRL